MRQEDVDLMGSRCESPAARTRQKSRHATTAAFSDAKTVLIVPRSGDTKRGHVPDGM
jgi:hypothetical protein